MGRHSKDSIDRYFDYDFHLEGRLIWIGSSSSSDEGESGTDVHMAERLIKALDLLEMGPRAGELITIRANNPGGSWHHGMAMYDRIRACKAPVRIEAMGFCMSMMTIILQAADERVLHPNVRFMIHDGSDGFAGHARNMEAWGRESGKIRQEMYRIYAQRSGQPVGYWAKKCMVDWIMGAEEAVREGLADQILQPTKQFDRGLVKPKPKRKKKV